MPSCGLPLSSLGIEVGHYTDPVAETGVTVFLAREGACIGIEILGGNTGTFNTPAFAPGATYSLAHAVVLSGGSTYGLASVFGVMAWLEEHRIGHHARAGIIPGVTGAVIYDLGVGRKNVRPGFEDGYHAARHASSGPVEVGRVGVGTGATVGKWYRGRPGRGGFSCATVELPHEILVSAFVVANSLGDIGDDGRTNLPDPGDDLRGLSAGMNPIQLSGHGFQPSSSATTLAVVVTNLALDNTELSRVARGAGHGLVRGMSPASLASDGDVVFALSSFGEHRLARPEVDPATLLDVVSIGAAEAVCRAVLSIAGKPHGLNSGRA
ncbi:P1 family peptidase [Nocardia brasiliensis]